MKSDPYLLPEARSPGLLALKGSRLLPSHRKHHHFLLSSTARIEIEMESASKRWAKETEKKKKRRTCRSGARGWCREERRTGRRAGWPIPGCGTQKTRVRSKPLINYYGSPCASKTALAFPAMRRIKLGSKMNRSEFIIPV